MAKERNTAIREAALLRNLIETCLKAAPSGMTGREVAEWPSVNQSAGNGAGAYNRVAFQLRNMVKKGQLTTTSGGAYTTYHWVRGAAVQQPKGGPEPTPTQDLHLKVDKARSTITFRFAGLNITIEVA